MTTAERVLRPPLLYNDATHTYTQGGVILPSVTEIIGVLEDLSSIPRSILEAKAKLGQAVHLCCELIDADNLDEGSVLDSWRPYVDAYRLFLSEHRVNWMLSEEPLSNAMLWYAGTLDRYGTIDDEPALADIKTRMALSPGVGVQTAAYERLVVENGKHDAARGPIQRFALQLKPDGKYVLKRYNSPNDWPTFLACLTVNNFKRRAAA